MTVETPASALRSEYGAGWLFQWFRDGTPRTRSELVTLTGLARSTVGSRIDQLVASGLLASAGEAASSGGRPPARIAFDPSARTVLAVDLGARHGVIALTDLRGDVITSHTESLDINDGPEPVLTRVLEVARTLLAEAGLSANSLAGVGIGLPGPVEHSSGKATNPPIMAGWDGFDVPAMMGRELHVPVLVDNDVNVLALGEYKAKWPHIEELLFVKVSTGIGAGIISSGKLQRGAQGTAGDLGHVQVPSGRGVVCACGNTDCLEALASGPAIARALSATTGVEVTTDDVIRLARGGDADAVRAIRQAGRDVGEVLATCVNLINPSVIVVGGSIAHAGEHLMAGVREVVYRRSLPLATQNLRIVPSRSGELAGVRGAAMLVVEEVLSVASIDRLVASLTPSALDGTMAG